MSLANIPILSDILSLIGFGSSNQKGGNAPAQQNTEVMNPPIDTLTSVQISYKFHRGVYHILIKLALLEGLIILGLIGGCIWVIISATPLDRFFVSSVNGRINRVIPLDVPTMEGSELFSRTVDDVAAALTFGYLDYEQRRIEASAHINDEALQKLQFALIGTGGISQMTQDDSFYSAAIDPTRGGGIIRSRVNSEFVLEWVMNIPLNITYHRNKPTTSETITPWNVTVLVQRARRLETSLGYVITQVLDVKAVGPAQPVTPAANNAAQEATSP